MKISAMVMILLLITTSTTRAEITARDVWVGLLIASKVIAKTQSGTWSASVHEEVHQVVKDMIRKAGEN